MTFVVFLNLRRRNIDCGILGERIIHADVVYVRSCIIGCNHSRHFETVQIIGFCEERAVFGIILPCIDAVLNIAPICLKAACFVSGNLILNEIHKHLGVVSLPSGERLEDDGRGVVAHRKVQEFCFAYGDACIFGVFNKKIFVYLLLPCGVTDLFLLGLALCA